MKPIISVIIPTRNRASELGNCLKSLTKQEYERFEVIVVDGSSTNDTKNMTNYYSMLQQIRFYTQTGKGISNARNEGAKLAQGEFVVYIDDDVIAPKNWLKNLIKRFRENPDLGFMGGMTKFKVTNIYEEWIGAKFTSMDKELQKKYVHGCNMAFRRKILMENLFDEGLLGAEDTEIQFRLNIKGIKCKNFADLWVHHNHEYKNIFALLKQFRNYSRGLTTFYSKYNIIGLLKIGDVSNLGMLFVLFWAIIFYISNTIIFSIIFSAIFLALFLFSFRNFYRSNSFRKVGIAKKIIFIFFDIIFSTYMSILLVENRIKMKMEVNK